MTISTPFQAEQATAANRSGQMTDAQQRRLVAAVRAETSQGLIGAGSAAALFLICEPGMGI